MPNDVAAIHRSLSRALDDRWMHKMDLDLDRPHRFAILSDQHKGAGDQADEFRKCREAYVRALESYLRREFSLILLGDVEELWENGFGEVERTYRSVMQLEASFPAERYYRVWGNHDDRWMEPAKVAKNLGPYVPGGQVYEGLRFRVVERGREIGTLFLVHGHQGTFDSDKIRPISRIVVRLYRFLQNALGIGKQTPSQDACLRGEHDRTMYGWASGQRKLILIAGHTHRPVWAARTHLQKLQEQLKEAEQAPRPGDPAYEQRVADLRAQIANRTAKYPPCNDPAEPPEVPCYFNTGCCKFDDGDITAIELETGDLRLVKWPGGGNPAQSIVLESGPLASFFERLP